VGNLRKGVVWIDRRVQEGEGDVEELREKTEWVSGYKGEENLLYYQTLVLCAT